MLCYFAECHYAECRILFTIMLNVVMLSVIMLSVIAPFLVSLFINIRLAREQHSSLFFPKVSDEVSIKLTQ